MAHDLIKSEKEALVASISDKGAAELMKPLIQRIYLFDTHVAGTSYLEDKSVLDNIKQGDSLHLIREDENEFDDNAIAIYTAEGKKLGYVPEKDNIIFSRLMDAGKKLEAVIGQIEWIHDFCRISIEIYLVDF